MVLRCCCPGMQITRSLDFPPDQVQGAVKVLALLDKLDQWVEDIPPLQTPQRFGNLAFRKWGQRLEEVG